MLAIACVALGCEEEKARGGPPVASVATGTTSTGSTMSTTTSTGGGNGSGGSGVGGAGGFGGAGDGGSPSQACTGIYTEKCGQCMEGLCCTELAACAAVAGCVDCLLSSVCTDGPSKELALTTLACAKQFCTEDCFAPPP
ncbi:MAG: hypothetical protein EXR75_17170 [Myxococcales bacterium]|nr:hypothetical protein [Myxococcales bacterium]